MKQLKINNTSTPYWCVVVPKHSFDFEISMGRIEYWRGIKRLNEYWSTGEIKLPAGKFELLGCITSSGMDEGVREMCYLLPYKTFQDAALWILEHNQITITADQKAVVVKQIT